MCCPSGAVNGRHGVTNATLRSSFSASNSQTTLIREGNERREQARIRAVFEVAPSLSPEVFQ